MKLQKLGGYASIVLFCANIALAAIIISVFRNLAGLEVYDPAKMMAAYQASTTALSADHLFSLLVGILFVMIAMALQERMQAHAPHLMRFAVIAVSIYFALQLMAGMSGFYRDVLIAQMGDNSAYRAFLVFHECFLSAAVFALGWGFLAIGWAAVSTRALPRALGYILLVFGLLEVCAFAFSISQRGIEPVIAYLIGEIALLWLGIALLRKGQPKLTTKEMERPVS
jgi:hypothetical protein